MRKPILAALGLAGAALAAVAPSAAFAQAAQEIEIPVRVAPGEAFLLRGAISASAQSDQGELGYDMGYTLALEVLPEGVWRWSYEDVSLQGVSAPEALPAGFASWFADIASPALRLATDLDFDCRVDLSGACVELVNWPDWRERIENLVLIGAGAAALLNSGFGPPEDEEAALKDRMAGRASPASAQDFAQAIRAIGGIVLNGIDPQIAATALAMPMVTGLQGQTLVLGVDTPVEQTFAMPFGARPVRMTGVVRLESVDRRAGTATLVRTATLDEEGLKQSVTEMVEALALPIAAQLRVFAGDGQDPVDAAASIAPMIAQMISAFDLAYTEETRGAVDLRTGLVREGESRIRFSLREPGDADALAVTETSVAFSLSPGRPQRPRLGAD